MVVAKRGEGGGVAEAMGWVLLDCDDGLGR